MAEAEENSDSESLSSVSYEESFDEEPYEETGNDDDDDNEEVETDKNLNDEESKEEQIFISTVTEELSDSTRQSTEKNREKDESINQNEIYECNDYDDDDDDDDDNDEHELDYTGSSAKLSTDRPSDFNEDNYTFHFNFFRHPESFPKPNEKKYKNGTRKSLTFTNERMREIERHNQILLNKILTKGPSYECLSRRDKNLKKANELPPARKSSAAINRIKQQRQIDYENHILKQKLEAIAKRRTRRFY